MTQLDSQSDKTSRNLAKRIRRRVARLIGARRIQVIRRSGSFLIVVHDPEDGRKSHELILPRFLRADDSLSGLAFECQVLLSNPEDANRG